MSKAVRLVHKLYTDMFFWLVKNRRITKITFIKRKIIILTQDVSNGIESELS